MPKVRIQPQVWARPAKQMVLDQDLQAQQPSKSYQGKRLHQANENIAAIALITQPNPIATLAYDSMRAAVDVHANANSLKIGGRDKHQISVEYAHAELQGLVEPSDLEVYDELRQIRNKVLQYPDIGSHATLGPADANRYRDAAVRLVQAVGAWLKADPRPL